MKLLRWAYRNYLMVIMITFPVFVFAQNEYGRERHDSNETHESEDDDEDQRVYITGLSDFCFGAFYPGRYGGTIDLSKEGMRSADGSVVLLSSELNPSAAVFEIRCPSYTMLNVMIDEHIEMRNASGDEMICEPINNSSNNLVSPNNAEGGFLYSIGGRLVVPEFEIVTPGEYKGRFNVFIVLE